MQNYNLLWLYMAMTSDFSYLGKKTDRGHLVPGVRRRFGLRPEREESTEAGENGVMLSYITCTPRQILRD
jgi:hypothetical protein